MNEAVIVAARHEEKVLNALSHLRNGNIEDALAEFAEEFCFTDRALGLEFTEKERLREFLLKVIQIYLDTVLNISSTARSRP